MAQTDSVKSPTGAADVTALDPARDGIPEPFLSQPIRYIDRTRAWYQALGYEPYRWPTFDTVPFQPLRKPLADSRLALITTAAPIRPDAGDQGPGAAYNGAAKFFEVYSSPVDDPADVRISHIGYDRHHSTAEDPNTWLPLPRLHEAIAAGRLGSLAPRFHGVPTLRSPRTTMSEHAPDIVARCQADDVDVALLVPV